MGDLIRISRILNNISRLIQSYAAFKSIKQIYKGLGDILIAFCKIKIASVVDLLDLKPNWQFEIMFSYVSHILDITIDIIIFEQVAIMERPL